MHLNNIWHVYVVVDTHKVFILRLCTTVLNSNLCVYRDGWYTHLICWVPIPFLRFISGTWKPNFWVPLYITITYAHTKIHILVNLTHGYYYDTISPIPLSVWVSLTNYYIKTNLIYFQPRYRSFETDNVWTG